MKSALAEIISGLGWTVPRELATAIERISHSTWPEMVQQWSRLTPSGFPIELTVTDADPLLRWSAEVAGPEIDEAQRLNLVAGVLAEAGQPVAAPVLAALQAMQDGRDLQYGAWIGGRMSLGTKKLLKNPPFTPFDWAQDRLRQAQDERSQLLHQGDFPVRAELVEARFCPVEQPQENLSRASESRFKLYSEIPAGVPCNVLPLPPKLQELLLRLPNSTVPRMIGVEPARRRCEIYLRLPTSDPEDLRPFLNAAGYAHGLPALAQRLPDGLKRLVGRKLGISLAVGVEDVIQVSLFVSARTLFPSAPELLSTLIPVLTKIPQQGVRLTLVTLSLDPASENVSLAVGVTMDMRGYEKRKKT